MSDSVSSFQSQVASVLDSLVKVAAEEICKLFDTAHGGRSPISTEKAGSNIKLQYCVDADKPHSANLRTKPERDLMKIGGRNIRSVGVQVGGRFTAAQLSVEERGVVFWEGCDSEKPRDQGTPFMKIVEVDTLQSTAFRGECVNVGRGRSSSALVKRERTEDVTRINVPQGGLQIAPEAVGSDALPGSVQLALVERLLCEEVWGSSLDQSRSNPTLAEDPQVLELQSVREEPPEERTEQDPDGDDLLKTKSACELHALDLMEVVREEKSTDAEKAKSDLISLPGGSREVESSPVQAQEASFRDASSGCEMPMKAVWSFPRRQPCVSSSPDTKLLLPCSVLLVNMLHSSAPGKRRKAQRVKGFATPKDLRAHQRLHTGKRLCCFKQCENGVWRLQSVLTQGQSHDCKLCGKKFKRRKILRRHERFHLGERPYVCTKCQKTFVQRKSLRRHERFHTGERPHCCTHCGKSFRLKENLKSHLRFHTGERPYACVWCKKQFRILRNLERHKNACGTGASSLCRNQLQTKELAVD